MRFGEFLRTRLFEPLGMTDTAFWCPPEKINRFASCYQPGEGGGLQLQDDAGESTYAARPSLESGGGGLVSRIRWKMPSDRRRIDTSRHEDQQRH